MALMLMGIIPAQAATTTGSISGTIFAPAGTDFSQMWISVSDEHDGSKYGSAEVDSKGVFKVGDLSAGSYRISVSNFGGGLLDGYFGGDGSYENATLVKIAAGQVVTGKNITLVKEATISGKVAVPAGTTTDGIYVQISDASTLNYVGSASVNSDGTYKLQGLKAGKYKLEFSARGLEQSLLSQWYKNAATAETATVITVTTGQNLSAINATLAKGATISGKVTVPAGYKAGEVYVYVHSAGKQDYAGYGSVATDGSFKVGDLAGGSYKVEFQAWSGNPRLIGQWYSGASTFAEATPITVATGANKTGINAILVKGGIVTGKVTASGVAGSYSVDAFDSNGQKVGGTYSDSQGNYSLQGLATGSYKVAFNRASGVSLSEAQYYDNKGESEGLGAAKTLTVSAGKSTAGINANLRVGGTLTGSLLDTAGNALPGVKVDTYTTGDVLTTRSGTTGKDGKFTIGGLTTGNYMVVANPYGIKTATMPGSLYSGNVTVRANAKAIAAIVGKSVSSGTLSYKTATSTAPKALTAGTPTISGTTVSGQKLTANAGIWGPAAVTL
ncbi:carboxypeptidase-like regulatory domain-containing protein, partial [Arthrobacter sp. Sr24]